MCQDCAGVGQTTEVSIIDQTYFVQTREAWSHEALPPLVKEWLAPRLAVNKATHDHVAEAGSVTILERSSTLRSDTVHLVAMDRVRRTWFLAYRGHFLKVGGKVAAAIMSASLPASAR